MPACDGGGRLDTYGRAVRDSIETPLLTPRGGLPHTYCQRDRQAGGQDVGLMDGSSWLWGSWTAELVSFVRRPYIGDDRLCSDGDVESGLGEDGTFSLI